MKCREELKKLYTKFTADFPIVTIEDPFDQDDWDNTAAFTAEGVCQVRLHSTAHQTIHNTRYSTKEGSLLMLRT